MNRFTTITPSAYTPQSFQELAFVPMIKRQQHDEMSKNLAELDAIAVDPLNEHRDEALKLKLDIENKLGNLSGELASKGIDGLGKEAFYKLKKERDALVAPTGKIGQINAAKIAEVEAYKRFLSSDDAKSNSQEVNLANWEKHRKKYEDMAGRDKDGNIINIGDLGAVKYVDEQKMLSDARNDLGMNEESFKQASSMLNDTGNSNGTRFTVNTSKAGSTGSNYEQVKAMADYFNKRISDPSDPFRKSLDYTGRDVNKVWDQMSSHMGMMKKYQQSNESERSYGNVDYYDPSKDGENPEDPNNPDSIPEAVTTINSNENLLNGLIKHIENLKNGVGFDTRGNSTYDIHFGNKPKDVTSIDNPEYKDLAQKIINQSPSLKGLKTNDPKVVKATINYLNTHKNTQTVNRIITPTTSKDTRGYSADEISKYTKMKQDAMETSIRNGMKVFDSEGNLIEKPKSRSIIYNGEYTFNSVVPIKHTNSKTKFAPIAATMIDEDGNEQKVYVEQNPDREKDPLFKAQYAAFQTLKKANKYRGLKQPLKNTFTEENLGLRDVDVTYNDDGSIILKGKHYNGKNWEKMPLQYFQNDSDFVNYIHNLYN